MIIGFYQKRMVFQYIDQQIPGGIHRNHDPFSGETFHDVLINVIRHGCRDTACQDQHIPLTQSVQSAQKFLYFFFSYVRPLSVNLCTVNGFQLQVDSGDPFPDLDEVRLHANLLHFPADLIACKSGGKSQGGIFNPQILQHCGYIDPLAARQQQFGICPVSHAKLKILNGNDIIQ